MTRRIIGPLRHPITDTLTPLSRFSVTTSDTFANAGATYPRAFYPVVTDENAQFDLLLATPASGTVAYTFAFPGAPEITLNIGSGPDTTLHALIAAAGAVVAPSALQAEADARAAADAALQAEIDVFGVAVASVNGQTGIVVLDAGDVGADAAGVAAGLVATEATARSGVQTNLTTHAALTTAAHGGIVASSDARLTDSRTPTAHAHPESDVTSLVSDLALKATAASVTSEASTRAAADTTLQTTIDANTTAIALKAPLASPALTGTPTAPTAAIGTNTTQLATTAFTTGAVATEATRATAAEGVNTSAIAANAAAIGTSVLAYGAVGNGTTDDTLAIRAAITAAGTNGTLVFPSGKTFLHSGNLEPLAGQTWIGYGATLKRRAEISSATSTNITTSGAQAITVANGALFFVGQDVTVFNGASYDTHQHRILSIVGNVLNVGTAFTTAFPSGGTVITSITQIYCILADVNIIGLEFDGNQANNATLQKWDLNAEMFFNGDRNIIHDCYLHDTQCEGIEVGGVGVVVDNCFIQNTQGNGIHLFGAAGAKITRNYVKNCNLAGVGTGHADGCIIASNTVGDTVISQNYCENGIAGIGSWDSDDNSSLICTQNIIKSCTACAFEGTLPAAQKVGKIIFAENMIYGCVKFFLTCANTNLLTTQGAYRVMVANNYFENTPIWVQYSGNDITITGNMMVDTGTSALNIYVDRCANVAVTNNTIIGGGYGIYVDGTTTRDLMIANNRFKNNQNNGVRFGSAPAANVFVDGNLVVIESTFTPSSSYAGLQPGNGVNCINNTIDIGTNTAGQYGVLCPNGGASVPGAVVAQNIIRSLANVPSIRAAGGSVNNMIMNNFIVQAVSNAGTNTVSGNTTIF